MLEVWTEAFLEEIWWETLLEVPLRVLTLWGMTLLTFFLVVQLADSYITDQRLKPCPVQWKQSPYHWTVRGIPSLIDFLCQFLRVSSLLAEWLPYDIHAQLYLFLWGFFCIYHKQVTSMINYYRYMFYFPLDSVLQKLQQFRGFPEKAMATHSSTLAWKIPWMEELGRLQSVGSRRVGHDWATSLSLFTFMHWRKKWQPTPVFLPGESQGRGSLVGCCLWGHTESDTTEVT